MCNFLYMRKYRNYSNNDLIMFSKEVKSMAQLLRKLNLKVVGGNYAHMKQLLQKLGIDCNHWTGKAWNRGQRLKNWDSYSKVKYFRKHLIKERGIQCQSCQLKTWLNFPIPLEIHHVDGDRTNNKLDNLLLLCCNCHSQTDNWRGKQNKLN